MALWKHQSTGCHKGKGKGGSLGKGQALKPGAVAQQEGWVRNDWEEDSGHWEGRCWRREKRVFEDVKV